MGSPEDKCRATDPDIRQTSASMYDKLRAGGVRGERARVSDAEPTTPEPPPSTWYEIEAAAGISTHHPADPALPEDRSKPPPWAKEGNTGRDYCSLVVVGRRGQNIQVAWGPSPEAAVEDAWDVNDAVLASARQPWERQRDEAHRRLDDAGVDPGPIDVRIGQLLSVGARPQGGGASDLLTGISLAEAVEYLHQAHPQGDIWASKCIAAMERMAARPQGGGEAWEALRRIVDNNGGEGPPAGGCEVSISWDDGYRTYSAHISAGEMAAGAEAPTLEMAVGAADRCEEGTHVLLGMAGEVVCMECRGSGCDECKDGGHVPYGWDDGYKPAVPRPPVGGEPRVDVAPDEVKVYPPCSCTMGNRWVCVSHCGGHPIPNPEPVRLAPAPEPTHLPEPSDAGWDAAMTLVGRVADGHVHSPEQAQEMMETARILLKARAPGKDPREAPLPEPSIAWMQRAVEANRDTCAWLLELGADDTHENARRIERIAAAQNLPEAAPLPEGARAWKALEDMVRGLVTGDAARVFVELDRDGRPRCVAEWHAAAGFGLERAECSGTTIGLAVVATRDKAAALANEEGR